MTSMKRTYCDTASCWRADKEEGFLRRSPFNFIHSLGTDAFEKSPGRFSVELRIDRFNAKKEAISRRHLETLDVENGMIRHRQTVEREQSEDGRQCGHEDRQLKGYRNEHRPAIKMKPAVVPRIIDN